MGRRKMLKRFSLKTFLVVLAFSGILLAYIAKVQEARQLERELNIFQTAPFPLAGMAECLERSGTVGRTTYRVTEVEYRARDDSYRFSAGAYIRGQLAWTNVRLFAPRIDGAYTVLLYERFPKGSPDDKKPFGQRLSRKLVLRPVPVSRTTWKSRSESVVRTDPLSKRLKK